MPSHDAVQLGHEARLVDEARPSRVPGILPLARLAAVVCVAIIRADATAHAQGAHRAKPGEPTDGNEDLARRRRTGLLVLARKWCKCLPAGVLDCHQYACHFRNFLWNRIYTSFPSTTIVVNLNCARFARPVSNRHVFIKRTYNHHDAIMVTNDISLCHMTTFCGPTTPVLQRYRLPCFVIIAKVQIDSV